MGQCRKTENIYDLEKRNAIEEKIISNPFSTMNILYIRWENWVKWYTNDRQLYQSTDYWTSYNYKWEWKWIYHWPTEVNNVCKSIWTIKIWWFFWTKYTYKLIKIDWDIIEFWITHFKCFHKETYTIKLKYKWLPLDELLINSIKENKLKIDNFYSGKKYVKVLDVRMIWFNFDLHDDSMFYFERSKYHDSPLHFMNKWYFEYHQMYNNWWVTSNWTDVIILWECNIEMWILWIIDKRKYH